MDMPDDMCVRYTERCLEGRFDALFNLRLSEPLFTAEKRATLSSVKKRNRPKAITLGR